MLLIKRKQVFSFNEFFSGSFRKHLPKNIKDTKGLKFVCVAGGVWVVLAPQVANAQTQKKDFDSIVTDILNIVDWLLVGVIVFAGTSWMFGNRTKAMEYIIGGSMGYLVARHAIVIKDWLRGLTPA